MLLDMVYFYPKVVSSAFTSHKTTYQIELSDCAGEEWALKSALGTNCTWERGCRETGCHLVDGVNPCLEFLAVTANIIRGDHNTAVSHHYNYESNLSGTANTMTFLAQISNHTWSGEGTLPDLQSEGGKHALS